MRLPPAASASPSLAAAPPPPTACTPRSPPAAWGSKVLIIYGEQAQPTGEVNSTGPDYKSFNATGVLQAAGLRTFVATSGTAARTALADAVAAAEQGTTAALLLPTNVQHAEIHWRWPPNRGRNVSRPWKA